MIKRSKAFKASRARKVTPSCSPPTRDERADRTQETAPGWGGSRKAKQRLSPVAEDWTFSFRGPATRVVYYDPAKELPSADGFAGEKHLCWPEGVYWNLSSAVSG